MKSVTEIKMLIRLFGLASITTGVYFAISSVFRLFELSRQVEAKIELTEASRGHRPFDYGDIHSSYLEILWKPFFFLFVGYLAFSATNLIVKAISNKEELK